MFLRKLLPTVMMFILGLGAVAIAQQPQNPSPDGSRRPDGHDRMGQAEGHRRGRMGRQRGGELRGLRELNLTEAQSQQQRAITQRHLETIKLQREELFKLREKRTQGTFTADDEKRARALRQEIHNSMQAMHSEIEGILTPEQRTKLEQIRAEQKTRHDERKKRHEQGGDNTPQ